MLLKVANHFGIVMAFSYFTQYRFQYEINDLVVSVGSDGKVVNLVDSFSLHISHRIDRV